MVHRDIAMIVTRVRISPKGDRDPAARQRARHHPSRCTSAAPAATAPISRERQSERRRELVDVHRRRRQQQLVFLPARDCFGCLDALDTGHTAQIDLDRR